MIRFDVLGHPVTQGSKRAFVTGGKARLVEDNGARHKGWRADIHGAAQTATERLLPDGPFDGPVAVRLTFRIQRPKSHPKTRRTWPTKRGLDIDKLTRAVLDAMTGVVFLDDAQVVDLRATKDYSTPGVLIEVYGPDELAAIDRPSAA